MLKRIILIIHWSSIDVCLGVLSLMIPLYFMSSVKPSPLWFVSLPTTVWVIYFLDHWLDNKKNKMAVSNRHAFLQKNQKLFTFIFYAFVLFNIVFVFMHFNQTQFIKSTYLIAACFLYFLLTYWGNKWFFKELLAAIIFAFGICIYPYIINENHINDQLIISYYGPLLFYLAIINLFQISIREAQIDYEINAHNITRSIGLKLSKVMLLFFYFLSAYYLVEVQFNDAITIGFTVVFVIHLLHFTKIQNKYYRIISEFSFMLIGLISFLMN